MPRKPIWYEKVLFDIIKEYNHRFFYTSIFRIVDKDECRIKVEKDKGEMVAKAFVNFPNGDRIDYELRFNRIVNLSDGYTLCLPGFKTK